MTGPELIAFIDQNIKRNEKGEPFPGLSKHQRKVLTLFFAKHYRMRLWSEIKKSGKTFLAASIAIAECFTRRYCEVVNIANDEEQSIGRVFKTCVDLCELNPELKASVVKVTANEIRFSNGSTIKAVSSDYKGQAGGRQVLTIFDELWAFSQERMTRLFDEMRPPPTETGAYILIVSYAGFSGESTVLESLYERGLKGKRVHRNYEVYTDGAFIMFWSHVARQPWQTKRWLDEEEKDLAGRPNQFRRLYRNEWVSSESTFISGDAWDACVDKSLVPMLSGGFLHLGIDIGVKNDSTGVVGVVREGDRVRVALHRVWKPWLNRPVNLDDVENFILGLKGKHQILNAFADPSQALQMIQRLTARGVAITEFPQTVTNCTQMGSTLFTLVNNRNLVTYESAELKEHVTNAVGKESPRGVQMIKSKVSRKIDLAIAAAMACVSVICGPVALDLTLMKSFGSRAIRADRSFLEQPGAYEREGLHPMDVLLDARRGRTFW